MFATIKPIITIHNTNSRYTYNCELNVSAFLIHVLSMIAEFSC